MDIIILLGKKGESNRERWRQRQTNRDTEMGEIQKEKETERESEQAQKQPKVAEQNHHAWHSLCAKPILTSRNYFSPTSSKIVS
jgi:hypothetical protein